jgi:endoglucanase Acf2
MKANITRSSKRYLVYLLSLVPWLPTLQGQTPINIGSGSYASFPPASANVDNFQKNAPLYLEVNEARAVPTNDWWTSLLFNKFGDELWAYPLMVNPGADGFEIFYPNAFDAEGSNMKRGPGIKISGSDFNPESAIAADWSDWSVMARMKADGQQLDATLVHGSPFCWIEAENLNLTLSLDRKMHLQDSKGDTLRFPFSGSSFVIKAEDRLFGIHLPAGVQVIKESGNLVLEIISNERAQARTLGKSYLVISAVTELPLLLAFDNYARNIPRKTTLAYNYDPEAGKITSTWHLQTRNLDNGASGPALQGFIPHHYKNATQDFEFSPIDYMSSRGKLRLARGTSFSFSYDFQGILPNFPAPISDPRDNNAYDPKLQGQLIDNFAKTMSYGGDTYFGGKDLVKLAFHTLMAEATEHPKYAALKEETHKALKDWLTYTPGETERYFAYYPRFKALIGFKESFGSSKFTDNHFHYGYLVHACALYGMVDPEFIEEYGAMVRLIAQQYANWDRTNEQFPWLRTFDPWIGHSYADGRSHKEGNNQESTSEAMQSWIGMFILAELLNDSAMRSIAAFGYLSEKRATLEYWFDWDEENHPEAYEHSMVGILYNARLAYTTFFSGSPVHIHGIQYIPPAPGLNYFAENPVWAKSEYEALLKETRRADGHKDEADFGGEWALLALGMRAHWDPAYVTEKMEKYDRRRSPVMEDKLAAILYYFAHAQQNLGMPSFTERTNFPLSTVYRKAGALHVVAYNASTEARLCTVYNNSGETIGSFEVAGQTTRTFVFKAP